MNHLQTYQVFIHQWRITTIIGIDHNEQAQSQDLICNINLHINPQRFPNKDLYDHDIVCYKHLQQVILGKCLYPYPQLLETLAQRMAQTCLNTFSAIQEVTVQLEKPHKFPHTQAVGIKITQSR